MDFTASRAQQHPQVVAYLALIDHGQTALLAHRFNTEASQDRREAARLFSDVLHGQVDFATACCLIDP